MRREAASRLTLTDAKIAALGPRVNTAALRLTEAMGGVFPAASEARTAA